MSLQIKFEPSDLDMNIYHKNKIILFQPHKPNGEPWLSKEEATVWAEEYYADWVTGLEKHEL